MSKKKFWIKERYNPQLGVYYVPCGQLSKAAAKRKEHALYGDNIMLEFDTEDEYNAKVEELRRQKKDVR
jgi:hypothetical protein